MCYSPILFVYSATNTEKSYDALYTEFEKLKAENIFDASTISKWQRGVEYAKELEPPKDDTFIFYFLGNPIPLNKPLLKHEPALPPLNLIKNTSINRTVTMTEFYDALLNEPH